ncbi:hypothetical protein LEP1GSC029_3127 [Leptospira interrogans str. 2002000626]|nr:hypothetical protein LEP1GSC029_3127 [Leptospira interrogans str. 2002000626]
MQGRGFVAVMDSDSDWIGGLRRRDRFQGHAHELWLNSNNSTIGGTTAINWGAGPNTPTSASTNGTSPGNSIRSPIADGNNGLPRTGKTTDARGLSAFPYVFAKRVL